MSPARLAWHCARNMPESRRYALQELLVDDEDVLESFGFNGLHRIILGLASHDALHVTPLVKPLRDVPDAHGWTALHWAVNYGSLDDVNALIDLGSNVKARTKSGEMPLHLACSEQQTRCAEALLQAGAPVDALGGKYGTPLHYVGYGTRPPTSDLIQLLLSYGADVNSEPSGLGFTPLHACCTNRFAVQTLVEHGADIDRPNEDGNTPAMLTVRLSALEPLIYLREHGARLDQINIWGYNVLHQAAYGADVHVMRYLATQDLQGIDPDLEDEDGTTPLKAFQDWRLVTLGKSASKDEEWEAFNALQARARSQYVQPVEDFIPFI
ncbi:ankyrin [Pyrenochaeta sp. DS3sAY3a]|nr:ankyrin [Pyrenochaeta sp. DS3sAY3a]